MSPGISTRLLATQSDERLLRLVREGHERAFEALVNRYRKPLLNYCRRLSLPEARTEDVLQQALMKTWIALRDGAEVRDIKSWLYRVVHNAAVNAVRDAAHDRERVADPTLRIEGGHADIERGLAVREALAEVAALPPLQREVIVRTAVGGYSHEQVASDLGLSDGAVRGLLYRARTTLRTATTALTPPQLLIWLAGRADQSAGAPERLSELASGGGTVGLGGLLLKGGVAAVTAGTLITGAAVVQLQSGGHRHHVHPGALVGQLPNGTGTRASNDATTVASASAGSVDVGRAGAHGSHTRNASIGSPSSAPALHGDSAGEPSHRDAVVVRHRSVTVAPVSAPDTATPTMPTASVGPVSGGSTSDQGSSSAGSGAASPGAPTGSAASGGSSGGSGSEAPSSGGAGSGQQTPSGSESGGSTPSGGSSGESSGTQSGSSGSGSSGGEQSGGLVTTVVHEVGNVVEHLLH